MTRHIAAAIAVLAVAAPAYAQFSDSYNFLKAVRDKDVLKAKQFLDKPGSVLVNTRDKDTGETALHIVVKRRDVPWIAFMLQQGADPNVRDADGNTAINLAAGAGYAEGVRVMLLGRANPDLPNSRGETPLIRAVQIRDTTSARMLLDAGADPDRTDSAAGLSARDYAAQDRRGGPLAKLLADAPKKTARAVAGPTQ